MARPDRSTRAALLRRSGMSTVLRTAMGGVALWVAPAFALPTTTPTITVNIGGGAPVLTNAGAVQDIKLNAPRTLLQYGGFTVAGGETVNFRFDNRSDLAVVHSTNAIQVDGTLNSFVGSGSTYGGNVWLLSAAGVFFGAGAHVDVGGLLASTSIPTDLTTSGALLTPGALAFDFGNGTGAVTVANGAVINGHGGTLAFIAPSVTTAKGSFIGGGTDTSVVYGAAQRYTVRFVQEAGNDLDLLDFEVPGLTAGSTAAMPLQLAGTTTAGNVYIASVSRADAVNSVLELSGSITATTAGLDGGTVVLTAGGGITGHAAALLPGSAFRQDIVATGGISAAYDVTAIADGVTIGSVNSGGSLSVTARTGDAHVDFAATALDLSVVAANGLAQMGEAHVGQDFLLSGKTVELGSLGGYNTPGGGYGGYGYGGESTTIPTRDITILASAGGFTYDQSLTATRDLTINVSGDLVVSQSDFELPPAVLTAGDDVRLHGANVTVDTIVATGAGPDTEADLSNIVVTGGTVTVYEADSANDILVNSPGLVQFGSGFFAHAVNDIIITAGDIQYGSLDAGNDLKLTATAGTLSVVGFGTGGLSSGRDVLIDVSGDLVTNGLEAIRDLTLLGATITTGGPIIAGRDVTATARTGALTIVDAKAGDDVRLTGKTINAETITSTGLYLDSEGDGSNVVLAGGDIDVFEIHSAHDLLIDATGLARIGTGFTANAANDIIINAGNIEYGAFEAGRDLKLTATAGTLTAVGFSTGGLLAGRDLLIDVSGDLVAGGLTAVRDLTLLGATITAGSATAGRDVTVTARTGTLAITDVEAGDDVHLTGATIDVDAVRSTASGDDSEGDGSNIFANGGTITLEQAVAATDIQVVGTGVVTVGSGAAGEPVGTVGNYFAQAGQDILITGGSVLVGPLYAGRDIGLTATAGGIEALDTILAGRDVIADATGAASFDGFVGASRDITLTAPTLVAGSLDAERDITATAGSVDIGSASSRHDVLIAATTGDAHLDSADVKHDLTVLALLGLAAVGDARVGGDLLMIGKNVSLGSLEGYTDHGYGSGYGGYGYGGNGYGGAFTLTQNATLIATAGDVTGNASLFVANNVLIDATGDVALGDLQAGNDVIATAGGSLGLADVSAGRDVILEGGTLATGGIVSGRDLSLTATASGITVGDLSAVRDLTLDAFANLDAGHVGAGRDIVLAGADVTVTSAVAIRDLTVTGTLGITGDLFQAGGNLVLDPNQPIHAGTVIAGGNASLIGASIDVGSLTVGGTTFAQATAGGIAFDTFHGAGNTVLIATGKVDLGDVTTAGLRIVGGDLDVRSSLVASSLTVETPGAMIIGGTAGVGETGFRLAAADIGRLKVSGIASFFAGVTTAGADAPGGNLTIQDFGYNPANLPKLAFFADRTHVVDITGHVAPSVSGGAIQIGDSNVDGRFRPASIYVSGGLGTAELVANCFGKIVGLASLSMFAVNDIIFGASDFRGVIQSTAAGAIDLGAGAPGVPAGPGDDRLFVVSARFNVDAGGKIVSQNTASSAGAFVGMVFTGIGAPGDIVGVGNARAIDLAGSLVDANGFLRSGPAAAKAGELGPGGTGGALFRFNGCIVGGADCTGQPGANPGEALRVEAYQPPRPIDITDGPLTTVLVIDQQLDGLEVLTVDNEGKVVVIKKKPGE